MITFRMLRPIRNVDQGHRFEMSTKFSVEFSLKLNRVSAAKDEDDSGDKTTHIVDTTNIATEEGDKRVFLNYHTVTNEREMQI